MEVTEPISMNLAICDFIQHARIAISRGAAIANSQCDFSCIVWQQLSGFNSEPCYLPILHETHDSLKPWESLSFSTPEFLCDTLSF